MTLDDIQDNMKGCCSRCKYRMYSLVDSTGGTMCRYFWKTEECEYYKAGKEMMKSYEQTFEATKMAEEVRKVKQHVEGI